ncbi:hypothetical protein BaRGS_00040226, partial [Batillaria attramentaria]
PGRVLDLLIGIGEHEYLQNVTVDPDCSPALSFGGHITDQSETSSVLINARVHTNDFQECTLSELTDQATNGPNVLDLKAQDSAPDVETILNCLRVRKTRHHKLDNQNGTTYNGAQAAPVSGHGLEDAFVHWRAIPRVENKSSTSSSKSSNPYDEVQDRPVPIERAPLRLHKRHCQAPREDPNDYLHPAATSSDLQETATAASDDSESTYRNCSSTPLDNTQMSGTRHFK